MDFFFFFIGEICKTFFTTVSSFVLAIVAEFLSVKFNFSIAVYSVGTCGISIFFLFIGTYFLS